MGVRTDNALNRFLFEIIIRTTTPATEQRMKTRGWRTRWDAHRRVWASKQWNKESVLVIIIRTKTLTAHLWITEWLDESAREEKKELYCSQNRTMAAQGPCFFTIRVQTCICTIHSIQFYSNEIFKSTEVKQKQLSAAKKNKKSYWWYCDPNIIRLHILPAIIMGNRSFLAHEQLCLVPYEKRNH